MCRKIHSCKLFIGNLSAPLAFSIALHTPCIGILPTYPMHYYTDVKLNSNLTKYIPSYQVVTTQEEMIEILREYYPTPTSTNEESKELAQDVENKSEI
jgi:ADP-heptose:LPS heptosyltransferase